MSSAYNSKALAFSLTDLSKILKMDDEQAVSQVCESFGLSVGAKGVTFLKSAFKSAITVSSPVRITMLTVYVIGLCLQS